MAAAGGGGGGGRRNSGGASSSRVPMLTHVASSHGLRELEGEKRCKMSFLPSFEKLSSA